MSRQTLSRFVLLFTLAALLTGCAEATRYIDKAVDISEQIGRTADRVSRTSDALSASAEPWMADEQGVSPFGVEAVDTVKLGGVTVQVKQCTISSQIVSCTFLFQLSPELPSKEVYFEVNSAYTPDGQELGATRVAIGKSSGHRNAVRRKLASGVDIEGNATFNGVPPTLRAFRVITVKIDENELQFRNIPVTAS